MYGFDAMAFNIHGGYLEAIVRGHYAGLLTAADYNNLCQCETLNDIKMHLSATEHGPYLQNGHLTSRSDVYSFRVVLLESGTGRRSMDKNRHVGKCNLVEWVRPYLGDKRWFY